MKYRKKPIVIDAVQWDGNPDSVFALTDSGEDWPQELHIDQHGHLKIATLEGIVWCHPGSWIIRGVKGEFYPCADEVFQATYEPVSPAATCGWCK